MVALFSLVVGILVGPYLPNQTHHDNHHEQYMEQMSDVQADEQISDLDQREEHMALGATIASEMREQGEYACCLETPCTLCIAKTPGHGEGASCHCLDDIMNGVHPCQECIGGIMEGHGNTFLSQFFATAIAEKVGMQYLESLRAIIADMYGISVEEQV